MLRFLKLSFLVLIALLFILFAASNFETVEISLFPFPYSATLPAFLLVILCFGFGAIAAGIAVSLKSSKIRHQYVAEHKRAAALENELKGLKAKEQTGLPAIDAKTS